MAEVRLTEEIAAPAASVWELLSDFGGVHRWFPGATKPEVEGEGIGAIRKIAMGDTAIHERLEAFDAMARSFQYSIVEAPMPVKNYLATVSVEEIDAGRCRVHWTTTFDAVGIPEEQLAEGLEGAYRAGLVNVAKLAAK